MRTIIEDKNLPEKILWFGMEASHEFELLKFDLNSKRIIKTYQFDKDLLKPINIVYCVFDDFQNNLWLGTDYGLIKFNKNNSPNSSWLPIVPAAVIFPNLPSKGTIKGDLI